MAPESLPPDWHQTIRQAFERRGCDLDRDVLEELAEHAAASYAAARADGADAGEAVDGVCRQVDLWSQDSASFRARTRRPPAVAPPAVSSGRVGGFRRDVRYAVRLVTRRPGVAVTAATTMALGVAAVTSLFGLAYAVLLKPLPWPDAERLVTVTETREGTTRRQAILTNITYHAWNDHATTIEGLAAYSQRAYTVHDFGAVERIHAAAVTPNLFSLLGAGPTAGRLFGDGDRAVVISERLARRLDDNGLGRAVTLDGDTYTVVGVLPDSFAFPARETDLWLPYRVPPATTDGSLSTFGAIARLKPGVSAAAAEAEATGLGRSAPDPGLVIVAVFGADGPVDVSVVPLLDSITREVRPGILVLLVGVGLLMLSATGNLASLQLARATTRRRELALRAALGASRGRLARQLLIEAVVVGLAGGLAGLLLTAGVLQVLPTLLPPGFPRTDELAVNGPVLAFALGLVVAASLLVGLLPAWQAGRLNLSFTLSEDSLAPVGHGRRSPLGRTRGLIISGQVAVAVVLLAGASLLGRSFLILRGEDLGYDASGVLTARLASVRANPADDEQTDREADIVTRVTDRLRGLPGIEGVAFATALPLASTGESMMSFTLQVPDTPSGELQARALARAVTPSYFDVLGIRLVEGRIFTDEDGGFRSDHDRSTERSVLVVNETFRRLYLGDRAIGPIRLGDSAWEVVGVVADVRQPNAAGRSEPEMFTPLLPRSALVFRFQPYVLVRTTDDPSGLAPALRAIVTAVNPLFLADDILPLADRVGTLIARPRLYAVMAGAFATFAVLIAGVGLFGVLSHAVTQRTREIGVRSALGATPASIVGLVVMNGVWLAITGVAAGSAVIVLSARYVAALLYGVQPFDVVTFTAVPIVVLVATGLACFVPARRAATIDPLEALRHS